ncbi:hypothetical protein MMC07_006811 [Pseudocyphellaria aurata]|nr:hypothetical protein [Pseudocyphellaria aurata]
MLPLTWLQLASSSSFLLLTAPLPGSWRLVAESSSSPGDDVTPPPAAARSVSAAAAKAVKAAKKARRKPSVDAPAMHDSSMQPLWVGAGKQLAEAMLA